MPRGKRSQRSPSQPVAKQPKPVVSSAGRKARYRCNVLDGRRWLQNSISVWSDIRKSKEETRLKHPASFPVELVERLIESFLPAGPHQVLDPFAGTGSTLVAAQNLGKQGIGLELSPEYCEIARRRLLSEMGNRDEKLVATAAESLSGFTLPRVNESESSLSPRWVLHETSVTRLAEYVSPASIDLCITSPPYWNILTEQRTAARTEVRNYGNRDLDLGTIADYGDFLSALASVFSSVLTVLKPGAHCCVIVMDLRKKNRFYPLHSDLASRLVEVGYVLDDIIIWNRQADYNNLRPLGFPSVFRINKVHEFVLLLQKPT